MSLIKANAVQIGQSPTATQNFTLAVPSSPDGTIKLARGNAGATTQDVLSVDASGNINGLVKATGSTTARSLANRFADVVNVKDYGAKGDGIADDTAGIQAAINTGKALYFPIGIYLCNVTIPNTTQFHWYGDGSKQSILKAFTSASPVITNLFQDTDWCYSSISDIGILGQANYEDPYIGIGFAFGSGLVYPAGYSSGMENVGRVVFNRVQFRGLNIGVYKPYGNIGNTFIDCTWQWLNYGYYAQGIPILTHAGADTFRGGELNACEIAAICILDATPGTGDWNFDKTIIQFNRGFGIFADFGIGNTFRPLMIDIWDEANGTSYAPIPVATVTIQTLTGPQVLSPKGVSISGLRDYNYWGKSSLSNGIGTLNPDAPLGVWGNQRFSINLIGGGYGADWTGIGFSSEGSENTKGANIQSFKETGTDRNLVFNTGSFSGAAFISNGSVKIGNDAVAAATPGDGSHLIYGNNNTAAAKILTIAATGSAGTSFFVADSDNSNAANTSVRIGRNLGTGRSINAGGTINASGTDYAEYMVKDGEFTINKGDICGINVNGKLTNLFSESISFVVKSTNPSYVGGDTWGSEDFIGKIPEKPYKIFDKFADDNVTLIQKGETDEEYAEKLSKYEIELSKWNDTYESYRKTVDRIAFSGQVPVNVFNAEAGDYILPIQEDGNKIKGISVKNPTYDQYMICVGKVISIEEDGRAKIIVKIS
jgi:hypothetical protein